MEPRRRFRIVKELAEGAFGKVFLAEMITGDNFKSVVAIKLLHGKWVGHEEIVQRSRDEARILGLLHHRNIVRVEDLTSINGQCAIIMEYLEGVDLKTLIRYCRDNALALPRKVAFEIIASTATALDAAYHRKTLNSGKPLKLIHRDIKPSNVMVTVSGEVKVLDFGTAQAQFEHREAETQALAFGSAAYMAPERMMGDPDGSAGDIFSLGVTLFELLALDGFGKIFIRGEKFDEALNGRIDGLDLSDLGQARETHVRQVMRLLLAYEPQERPSAREVVGLMEALSDQVQDGSLRRFCREVVTPAHETLEPSGRPGDPFTGSTLFEDSSRVREEGMEEIEARVASEMASQPADGQHTQVLNEVLVGASKGSDFQNTGVADDGFAPPEMLPAVGQAEEVLGGDAINDASVPDARSSRSGPALLAALALVGLALGAALLYGGFSLINPTSEPTEIVVKNVRKYSPGGQFQTEQVLGNGGVLVLDLAGDMPAKVTISAALTGFNFRWDGTDVLALEGLEPGMYRVRIRSGEQTIGLAAKVESGERCAYRYDLDAGGEEWDDAGC